MFSESFIMSPNYVISIAKQDTIFKAGDLVVHFSTNCCKPMRVGTSCVADDSEVVCEELDTSRSPQGSS